MVSQPCRHPSAVTATTNCSNEIRPPLTQHSVCPGFHRIKTNADCLIHGGSSGISVGRPLSPAPPTKAVLPFVCTSHRSPALASDRWLAPTKAENPAFCTNAFDQCRRAARLIHACLSLECRASTVHRSAAGPTRNPDGPFSRRVQNPDCGMSRQNNR